MAIRINADTGKLKKILDEQRKAGRTIGLVPTMGFLHQGHLSLIERSRDEGCFTVVSVFVNPAQFGPNEDLDSYPSDLERDYELSVGAGADLVWYPQREDLYAPGCQTAVMPGALAQRLCGISRPLFFGGICTVVLKLFNLVKPEMAFFGEKDFQQLAIVKQMVADFYLDVRVIGCPTQRASDGLAMSSRNARIPAGKRDLATTLYRTLASARRAFRGGERDGVALEAQLRAQWPQGLDLDYLDFREPLLLEKVERLKADTRLFLGAWLDGVRLIDNGAIK